LKSILKYLSEIFYLIGSDKNKLPKIIFFFMLVSLLDLIGIGLMGPYFTLVINPEKVLNGTFGTILENIGIALAPKELIVTIGVFLVFIFLLKGIAAVFINRAILKFSWNRQTVLRIKLMKSYQEASYIKFIKRNSSDYVQSILTLVGQFEGHVLQPLLRLFSEGVVAIGLIIILSYTTGLGLLLLTLIVSLVLIIYTLAVQSKLKVYGKKMSDANRGTIQSINEGIFGFKENRILGISSFFNKRVGRGAREVSKHSINTQLISTIPKYLLEFVAITFVVGFILYYYVMVGIDSKDLMPRLGVIGVASIRLVPAFNLLIQSTLKLRFARYATNKIYSDFIEIDKLKLVKENNSKSNTISFKSLELSEVDFQYDNTNQLTLKDINLSIKDGESIGIIGPSGSGKTTLIDLLLGLLEPKKGYILYNDNSLKDNMKNWQAQIAYLPQEIFLIDDTLSNNVALGIESDKIDQEKIKVALKHAKLADLVNELPQGLETFIGERGVRLSGGQRQRVALARAFYHGRNILIMDEATSSLDNETEKEIIEEIKFLKGKKTVIVIAHRLSTVEHCDIIYKIDKGSIVSKGKFNEVV
jgi:ATP-binding cassette, subfamily B, bacterial PglK